MDTMNKAGEAVAAAVAMTVEKRMDWLRKRGERALELGTPEWVNGNVAYVPANDPERVGRVYYKVDVKRMSCTCEDWIYRGRSNGIPCKHLIRAMAEKVVRDSNKLPKDLADNIREADEAVKRGELPAHAPEHMA